MILFPYQNRIPQAQLQHFEMSWHLSVSYWAEREAVAVLEELVSVAPDQTAKRLLTHQLADEVVHAGLYENLFKHYELIHEANGFGEQCALLLRGSPSLAGKYLVLHFLSERAAAAYTEWRLQEFVLPEVNAVDEVVCREEKKHIQMGDKLLGLHDPQDVQQLYESQHSATLTKAVVRVCDVFVRQRFAEMFARRFALNEELPRHVIDSIIPRSVIAGHAEFVRDHIPVQVRNRVKKSAGVL